MGIFIGIGALIAALFGADYWYYRCQKKHLMGGGKPGPSFDRRRNTNTNFDIVDASARQAKNLIPPR